MHRFVLALLGLGLWAACDPAGGEIVPGERRHAVTRPAVGRPAPKPSPLEHDMVPITSGSVDLIDPHGERRSTRVAAFSLDRTEVTVREYWRCISAGACKPNWMVLRSECNLVQIERRDHPINCVGLREAEQYCAWRNKRLPTMAEWQRAAVGEGRHQPWGDGAPEADRVCWQSDGTCEVASRPDGASPDGVYDLGGNVWEISEPLCAIKPPRAGMCGDHTAAVHGGGYNTCPSHRPSCADASLARLVSTLDRVSPEAVGFRCAR